MSKCPKNKILNPKTGKCVLRSGKIGQSILSNKCPKNKILNPKTGKCVLKSGKIGQSILSKGKKPVITTTQKKEYTMNNYFDKIYIINLHDKTERMNKMKKQFNKYKIKYTRFDAVDGRCRGDDKLCKDKRNKFMKDYKVKIPLGKYPLQELLPASSLTIGTILILREMVKNNWDHILICEDDIVIDKNIHKDFNEGIKELEKYRPDWDVLYLGCGNLCGKHGVTRTKTKENKYKSTLMQFLDEKVYVKVEEDLRMPCKECKKISKNLTDPVKPGGTWCYGYSLAGAKKMLKFVNNNAANHIDQILIKGIEKGKLKAAAFDPPVVFHEEGAIRSDTDIPWEM